MGRALALALPLLALSAFSAAGCPFTMEDDYTLEASGAALEDPCGDGLLGEGETDVDCGGEVCARCPAGFACERDQDCASKRCEGGACAPCEDKQREPGCSSGDREEND